MWDLLLLILMMVLTIVITIAVFLGLMYLLFLGVLWGWVLVQQVFFPSVVARQAEHARALKEVPFFVRSRTGHSDSVVALAVNGTGFVVVSAGCDRTVQVEDAEWNREFKFAVPFAPDEIVWGEHPHLGGLFALGVSKRHDDAASGPDVLIYDAIVTSDKPLLTIEIPGIRQLLRHVWSQDGRSLRVLASVFDPALPLAPNNDPASPNRLVFREFYISGISAEGDAPAPTRDLPLPTELLGDAGWQIGSSDGFALSAGGRFLACRTRWEHAPTYDNRGVGVWNVDTGQWHRRFGGREGMPHDLYAVTSDGERVFSARQDDPRRDHRNGGPEWYDGLYVWDADSPPEGVEEAHPRSGWNVGGRGMIFNRDESLIAVGGWGGDVTIGDAHTGALLRELSRPEANDEANRYGHNVWRVAFAEEIDRFVTGHADGQVWWWDIKDLRTPAAPETP